MAVTIVFYIALGMCAILSTQAESRGSDMCCPGVWASYGETCYRLVAKPENWADAEAKCQQLGEGIIPGMEGHLISIHNQNEIDFVQTYYESSVIVQGRRKTTSKTTSRSKPNSYNALWLGLNKQDADRDTFVWSDRTDILTTFWQDALYNTNHKCGYMWASQSSVKGKWNDASCTTELPYMCKLVPTQHEDTENIDESSYSSSSVGLLPCSYRGTIILHGETLPLDECTACSCDNSTVKCSIRNCPALFCEEPVAVDGECCDVCPDVAPTDAPTEENRWEGSERGWPCSYRNTIFSHGEMFTLDECTTCTCNDSTVHCDIRSCQPTFCRNPFHLDDECCSVCPYDVPVNDVQLSGVDSVKAGTVNDISVDLHVAIASDGQSIQGSGLWKVGMWASRNEDGSGKKIGFEEQVLTDEQASSNIQRPPVFGGFEFSIPAIHFSLDASDTSCDQIQYLCASFNQGDAPETKLNSVLVPADVILFDVHGVESNKASSPNPARLVGCQPFTNCKDKGRKKLI